MENNNNVNMNKENNNTQKSGWDLKSVSLGVGLTTIAVLGWTIIKDCRAGRKARKAAKQQEETPAKPTEESK